MKKTNSFPADAAGRNGPPRWKLNPAILALAVSPCLVAATIDTTNAGAIAAFQSGATVVNFETIAGITPLAITTYASGTPIPSAANLFNQVRGVQFSVGGTPGTPDTEPVVLQLGGGIAGDAHSPSNVLSGGDMQGNTNFSASEFIEVYFPTKVARVGFYLDPGLGSVLLVAKSDQNAFSGGSETVVDSTGSLDAGHFVGFQEAGATIGGLTIIATSNSGFAIDDLTFGGTAAGGGGTGTPEPATLGASVLALGILYGMHRRRRAGSVA